MGIVATDLRETQQNPKMSLFQPAAPLTSTNVEDAINQVQGNISAATAQPPSITPTAVNTAMSPYAVLATDFLLVVDSTAGPVTILLPACAVRGGKELDIKDATGQSGANTISLKPVNGETVDVNFTNAAPYPLDANFNAVRLRPLAAGGWVTA